MDTATPTPPTGVLSRHAYERRARLPWRGGEPSDEPRRLADEGGPTRRVGIRVSVARYEADTGRRIRPTGRTLIDPIASYEVDLEALSPRARRLAEATTVAAGDALDPRAVWIRSRRTRRQIHGSPDPRVEAVYGASLGLDAPIEETVAWGRMYDRETPEEFFERHAGWLDEGLDADVLGPRDR
jgi:hypothetical protein